MVNKIKFDGKPKLERKRKLSEDNFISAVDSLLGDKTSKSNLSEREQQVDSLFTDIARTYIKGNVVKNGLSGMDPAQEIPIDEFDEKTRAAARRLDSSESREGSVITYSMYQAAIDTVMARNWGMRLKFLQLEAPRSAYESSSYTTTESKKGYNEIGNLLKEFYEENGIAGSILAMLTLAPFQSIIFQTLTVEEGAKTAQALQISAGLAIFIELGIKAEKIYNLLKKSKINFALTEAQIVDLEKNEVARAEALSNFGVDYKDLKDSMKVPDSEVIINYVSDYYARYGGLVSAGSHLSIDHWIAYLDVSKNQQSLRGALNTASSYSQKFRNIKKYGADYANVPVVEEEEYKPVVIHVEMSSVIRELNSASIDMYDDIVNAFSYQVTDRALCCLVSILGSTSQSNISLLRTLAVILRILATDLAANIVELDNIARRFIARKLQAAMLEIMLQLNEFYDKIQNKLAKTFTIQIPGLENCEGMLTIGFAIEKSIEVIYQELASLIRQMMDTFIDYGSIERGSWKISADRRHLLSIAKVLEIIADRIDLANICSKNSNDSKDLGTTKQEIKDEAARNVVHQLIEKSPPSIQITDSDYAKYFSNIQSTTSDNLNYKYGIPEIQNVGGEGNKDQCAELSEIETEAIATQFWSAVRTSFSE